MNKTILAFTALGLIAATQANADVYSTSWNSTAPPTKASYTITLSGECSGKITQEVESVSISHRYEAVGNQFPRSSSGQSVNIWGKSYGDDAFYTETSGNNYTTGDKFVENVAKGKKTISFSLTAKDDAYPRVWPISDEAQFANKIKCKGGKTLTETLGESLYLNNADASFKTKTTVKLVSSLTAPTQAEYSVKQTFSGIAQQGSLCIGKGEVGTEQYSVSCAQPKPVKVSVKISAQGTASLEL